jgi:hypothetical protein
MELNEDAYSDWQDQVLRIEYSARKKVHIYIRIPKGMTIEEAQQAFCSEVDIPYDENCITPERFIYVTGKDEEVYRSPHWLEALSDEELEERREAYLQRGLDVDGRGLKADGRGKMADGRGKMDDGRGNHKLQISNFKLQTSNFKLQISNFKLQTLTGNHKFQTSNFKLQTKNYDSPRKHNHGQHQRPARHGKSLPVTQRHASAL